jgi:hypothetical protein
MSVLLDTYLGVMPGDAEVSLQRVEDALDDALRDAPDDQAEAADGDARRGDGDVPSQTGRKDSGEQGQEGAGDDDE